jgi:hypothetical protein
MTKTIRTGLASMALAIACAASASTPAFAWGCAAVSDEGTFGYSHSYDTEDGAIERALNECANRTTDESECEITECEEDS